MALALIVSHLIIGIIVPRFFATGVRNLGPAIRGAAGELDNVMLDDMRGLDEIIRFGRGEDRAQAIEDRTRALWRDHAKLSRVNGRFAGVGGLLVALLTSAAAGIAINLAGVNLYDIPALVAAFALLASSFGPTLALAALPANLTQTFASARRLFGLMDEAPAVVETGTANSDYEGMRLDRVTFAYPGRERGDSRRLLARCAAARHPRYPRPVRPGQVHYAEAADALLGSAARPSDAVRHAATANRCACPPPYSGHDESGDPPVRRHDSRESAYRLA